MTAVFVRIALRYLVGALIAKGVLSPGFGEYLTGDPEIAGMVEIGLGLVIGGIVEGFYALARRCGWAK